MKRLFLSLMCGLALFGAKAEISLPSIIGNNMVLQRNASANLWGQAKPRSRVTITATWTKTKYHTVADADGHWRTSIPTADAGGPYELTFSDGKGKLTLTGVLLGEVWVCGGQSNMEMPVAGFMYQPVEGGMEAAFEANNYPDIHMFTVPRCISATPKADCDTTWCLSTPLNVRTFSAIAYFFGRELHKMLRVPVGIVTSNWGGTVIEAWMSRESLDATVRQQPDLEQQRTDANASTVLYNGMICPIKGFTAKGFIWYQGESNRHNWFDYAALQTSLIRLWRHDWGNDNMPFYITQIAPYCYEGAALRGTALFVDQQYKAAAMLDHCDVACTTDVGEYGIIHPAKKQIVSRRLAWMALTNDYGIEGLPSKSPRFRSFEEKEGKLLLSFDNLTTPYNFTISDPHATDCFTGAQDAQGFEVAGEDRRFFPARLNHKWFTNQIEVWSDSVPHPVAVRYAYHNWTSGKPVVTQSGLALPSFRSDDWEMDDIGIR